MNSRSSNSIKLALLFLITLAATGSVVYQIRARRAARPEPAATAPETLAEDPAPASAVIPPVGIQPTGQSEPAEASPVIPSGVWGTGGRSNPFLSMEEVARLNRPPLVATEEPPEIPEPPPPEMPSYSVTAIVHGDRGRRAVVGTRVVQPGDRLGSETVKEITERSVVLEFEGRTRVLTLMQFDDEIRQIVVPRGD